MPKKHVVPVGTEGVDARVFICIHFHTVCKFYKSEKKKSSLHAITFVHGLLLSGESSHSENA